MIKTDLTKTFRPYYTATQTPAVIDIGPASFLSITGKGDPSGLDFSKRIEALYSTAYTLKFVYKALEQDFVVAKLEGLWWFDEQRFGRHTADKSPEIIPRKEWEYRLLIRMPDFVTAGEVENARRSVVFKKGMQLGHQVGLFSMNEGRCVQMLHTGPFSAEPETLRKIVGYMDTEGYSRNGVHHEIYLSDFRKTPPEKLKTIVREPVK